MTTPTLALETVRGFVSAVLVPLFTSAPLVTDGNVYCGWPSLEELLPDLRVGKVHVSIAMGKNVKRVIVPINNPQVTLAPDISLTVTLSGPLLQGGTSSVAASAIATFGGSIVNGLSMILEIGTKYVSYRPPGTDTTAQVVSGFANAINSDAQASAIVTAVAAGSVLTVTSNSIGVAANAIHFGVKIGGTGTITWKNRQEKRTMEIHVWGYDNVSRQNVADAIDDAFENNQFLAANAADPWIRVLWQGDEWPDHEIALGVYRRILEYSIEYNETSTSDVFTILEGIVTTLPST